MYRFFDLDDDQRRMFTENVEYFADFKIPEVNIYKPKGPFNDGQVGHFLNSPASDLEIGTKFKGLRVGGRLFRCELEYIGCGYDLLPISDNMKRALKAEGAIFFVFRKVYSNGYLYAEQDSIGIHHSTQIINP